MGDTQHTIEIDGERRVVSGRELNSMLDNDPMGLIHIVKGGDSAYKNTQGDIVEEKLSAEQIRSRKRFGEENLLFGADDPKRELLRRDEQRRTTANLADRYDALVAMRNFVPGVQFAENAIVGKEDATRGRQQLIGANPITHMTSQLGAFVAGGTVAKGLLRSTKYDGIIGAHRSTILGKTTQLVAEDALLETYLYSNHILNNDTEFIADEWGAQVASGLLFVSPMIGSYAARAVAGKGAEMLAKRSASGALGGMGSVGGMVSRAADIGVVKGLMTKAGGQQAKIMRTSAGMRVMSRLLRKKKTMGARVSKLDIVNEKIVKNLDEGAEIEKYTPEWFHRPKGFGSRKEMGRTHGMTRLRELSGEALEKLTKIDHANVVPNIRKMNAAVKTVPGELRNLNNKIRHPRGIGIDDVDEAMYNLKVQEAFDSVHTAGYGDIANHLENTFHLSDPNASMGSWVQARLDAKLGKAPGWTVVDEVAGKFIADADVWKGSSAGRGQILNTGIDQIVKAHDELDKLASKFGDDLSEITSMDVRALEQINKHMDDIRSGYAKLESQGVLSRSQVKALETKLGKMDAALTKGKLASFDAVQINNARKAAEAVNQKAKRQIDIEKPKTPEAAAALREETALEGASMLVAIRDALAGRLHGLQSTVRTRRATFGLIAVKENTTQEERNILYQEVSEGLNGLAGNPMAISSYMQELVGDLEMSDPDMALVTKQKAAATTFYLTSQLPKPDLSLRGRSVPEPASRINAFIDKLISSYEPFSVGIAAIEGRITPGMIDALRNTNPSIYSEMTTVFSEELMGMTPEQMRKAPRNTMLGVETFLGGMNPGHVGMSLMQLQSTYAQTPEQQATIQGTGNTMRNPSPQDPSSDYTTAQRVTGP